MRTYVGVSALVSGLVVGMTGTAFAGGNEFPADGVRGIGRGGTSFTRADDPSVMLRNPALLADLWDDQAMIGGHVLMADACAQPTGAFLPNKSDAVNYGDGPFDVNTPGDPDDPMPTFDMDGNPLPTGLRDRPYPEVCFEGPIPYYPQVGLTMRLSDDLGVGIGFFPPEFATINQWGNKDGTVTDPANGQRVPNPLRYFGSHVNTSYFSLQGAFGYRLMPGLRVGLGFKWSLLALNATSFTSSDMNRELNGDVRADLFARDLFIPGIVASVQYTPVDAIDVAVGFKWEDRILADAKVDIVGGPFGYGKPFTYFDEAGDPRTVGSRIPVVSPNRPGTLNVPPISVPQLSFGLRYADRLKPRIRNYSKAKKAAGRHVEDHMSMERWDIEATAILYFNGFRDRTQFSTKGAVATLADVTPTGTVNRLSSLAGFCVEPDENDRCPKGIYRAQRPHGGNTQLSLRVGGDYNVLPGIFALRAGVSLENSGSDVGYHDPRNYDQERLGIHAGWTWRIAEVTDLTFGWAMFFHPEIHLAPNDTQVATRYRRKYESEKYNWIDPEGPDADRIDGTAKAPVPYRVTPDKAPQYFNHGTYTFDMQVFSLQLSQHF